MNSPPLALRLATRADAAAMLAVYAPYIIDCATSFEAVVPSEREFGDRVEAVLARAPWLIAESGGRMAGYAYAGRHRDREAYQWSVEPSLYIDARFHRQGVGRRLYGALFAILRGQGFCNAYAGITLPNPGSVAIHESFGFKPMGVYRKIGWKAGAWRDVGWWSLDLQETGHPDTPTPPKRLSELPAGFVERELQRA